MLNGVDTLQGLEGGVCNIGHEGKAEHIVQLARIWKLSECFNLLCSLQAKRGQKPSNNLSM